MPRGSFMGACWDCGSCKGDEVPETLRQAFEAGEAANFVTPDGTVIDLFWKPDLLPADPDPRQGVYAGGAFGF